METAMKDSGPTPLSCVMSFAPEQCCNLFNDILRTYHGMPQLYTAPHLVTGMIMYFGAVRRLIVTPGKSGHLTGVSQEFEGIDEKNRSLFANSGEIQFTHEHRQGLRRALLLGPR